MGYGCREKTLLISWISPLHTSEKVCCSWHLSIGGLTFRFHLVVMATLPDLDHFEMNELSLQGAGGMECVREYSLMSSTYSCAFKWTYRRARPEKLSICAWPT